MSRKGSVPSSSSSRSNLISLYWLLMWSMNSLRYADYITQNVSSTYRIMWDEWKAESKARLLHVSVNHQWAAGAAHGTFIILLIKFVTENKICSAEAKVKQVGAVFLVSWFIAFPRVAPAPFSQFLNCGVIILVASPANFQELSRAYKFPVSEKVVLKFNIWVIWYFHTYEFTPLSCTVLFL